MTDSRQPSGSSPKGRHVKPEGNADFIPQGSPNTSGRSRKSVAPTAKLTSRNARPARGAYKTPSRRGGVQAYTPQPGAARYGSAIAGKKKKGGPWRVVFWIAIAVLIASLVALGTIAFSYWQGQDKYRAVATEVFNPPADIAQANLADVTVDWEALRAINADTVGWIYVPDTSVNYPIVHTTNDDKYLKTDFSGEQSWLAAYGAIFLSAANAPSFSDANNIVYGHHMNDGSMFAQFAAFRDEAIFNAHRTIYIFTPEANYRLNTFSLVVVDANDPLAQTTFTDEAQMQSYIQDKIDRSAVKSDPVDADILSASKIFSFVTCSNYTQVDQRIVLFASVTATEQLTAPAVAQEEQDAVVDPGAAETAAGAAKEIA